MPWQRETRESAYADLPESVRSAVESYLERHKLAPLEPDSAVCCLTHSAQARRFGREETVESFAIATADHILWGRVGDTSPAGARRSEVEIREYDEPLAPDVGIELFGFQLGASERSTAFIGLGPGGDALRRTLGLGAAS